MATLTERMDALEGRMDMLQALLTQALSGNLQGPPGVPGPVGPQGEQGAAGYTDQLQLDQLRTEIARLTDEVHRLEGGAENG